MKPFGLTGNIGCGKSTVASLLSKYSDVIIIDCDQIAKDIISNAKHKEQINSILEKNVFADETVDFKLIAKIIFDDRNKKKLLEAFIHPLVWTSVNEKANLATNHQICVVESAIIFETNSEDSFEGIITATCNTHEQFRRLRENRHMSDFQIKARLQQQLSMKEKVRRSQFMIHTDCSLNQLKKRVDKLHQNLKLKRNKL